MHKRDEKPEPSAGRTVIGSLNVSERQETSSLDERNGRADCEQQGPHSPNERNERASWVAGHAVNGNAIVACVGTTYQSLGKLTWADVTAEEWHK